MVRWIFVIGIVLGLSSQAHAVCTDAFNRPFRPVAIADENGVVATRTPTGQPIRISGYDPGQDLCKLFLFNSASRKCTTGMAHLEEVRDPSFCKREAQEGRNCRHIVCTRSSRSD